MAEYSVWLLQGSTGQPLQLIDEFSFINYVRVVNGVGAFTIGLPDSFDLSLVQEDTRVAIWRQPVGGTKALDFVGFVRYVEKVQAGQDINRAIGGPDLNDLLRRRIIAYAAETTQAKKTGLADDVMKEIVNENMGAGAIAARQLPASFTIQANASLGTNIYKAAAWRNVLDVLKEISDDSHSTEATCAYFGIVPLNIGWECEFRTNIEQWGIDHRFPSGAGGPVVFSLDYGNINNVTRSWNYQDEVSYTYAGGQGEGVARNIQEATDAIRVAMSPFNLCEGFVDARNGETDDYVLAEAQAALRNGRPKRLFSGSLTDSGSIVYGRDYGFGDYVTAVFEGETIDCRIDAVTIHAAGNDEQVAIQLRQES